MWLKLPRERTLDLTRPKIMGILNVTPDSFSDGGQFLGQEKALKQANKMLEAGATIIDIGGESTRPGSLEIPASQEIDRVVPIIELLRKEFDCVLSIDTCKTVVMREALKAGADLVNDIKALQDEGAVDVAVKHQAAVCLMHMQGEPRTMQQAPNYHQVVSEVGDFLMARADVCLEAGLTHNQIILDPGFGFGKTLAHNYELLSRLSELTQGRYPVLAGMSRKSMIGQLLDIPVEQRLAGSVACATIAVLKGARILRVHDVKETAHAVAVAEATLFGV